MIKNQHMLIPAGDYTFIIPPLGIDITCICAKLYHETDLNKQPDNPTHLVKKGIPNIYSLNTRCYLSSHKLPLGESSFITI